MDTFPIDILVATESRWRLTNVSNSGDVSIDGLTRFALTDGGGRWLLDAAIPLYTRQQIKLARALEGLFDGGATTFVMPACECPFAPLPGDLPDDVGHSDDSPFSDESLYASSAIDISLASDAALRATTLTLTLTTAGDLEGGERFTIVHPTVGERLYTIVRIVDGVATIRPPLREDTPAGTPLDFDNPRCRMRVLNADAFLSAISMNRLASVTLNLQEAF